MTHPAVHLFRLLSWGRTLARHGALRGIERDPLTPPAVRRLTRIARFGARVPRTPAYADAFEAIGPAAIKLGQALATRPDLIGDEAARDLLRVGVAVGRRVAGQRDDGLLASAQKQYGQCGCCDSHGDFIHGMFRVMKKAERKNAPGFPCLAGSKPSSRVRPLKEPLINSTGSLRAKRSNPGCPRNQ